MRVTNVTRVKLDTPKQYYDVVNANPYNNFFIKTNDAYICSHNCFFDEVSFQQNQDVAKQKDKAKNLINTASARMQSRFMKGEKNPTLLVLASSKRTEQSYMETFIESRRKQDSKTTYVVDEPQWVIRTDKDSERKFKVAIGNKFLSSEVIPLNASESDLKMILNRGYRILDVPMGYYENFIEDIDIALTDIAGISTTSSNKYISGQRIAEVKTDKYRNAFKKEIIEVGNGRDDTVQYNDFFDLSLIPPELKSRPLYVHLDMSVDGDKTGIGGVWIKGKRPPTENHPIANDLFYTVAFSVSVKAPKGHQISFEKNRNFIYWLREQGFNVKAVTTDTFQSVDTGQQLASRGFNYAVVSVDRVDTDHICKPWQYFRSTLYEQRIEMYENTLLTEELIGLERDNNSGKIDHSPSGINCFTKDTKISLTDGRELSIGELLNEFKDNKVNYVYSVDINTHSIVAKPIIDVFCSGTNAKLVEVTLDNGEVIRCTPEHRFMLRDGSYCEAQRLLENDSLMPLYRKYPTRGMSGYRLYYEPFEGKWHYEHRRFASSIYDSKYLVHHIDCNKYNNNPTNLIWMSRQAHEAVHSNNGTGAFSELANKKRALSVSNSHKVSKSTTEGTLRYYRGDTYEERVAHKKYCEQTRLKKAEDRHCMCEFFGIDFDNLDKHTQQRYIAKWSNYKAGNNVRCTLSELDKKSKMQHQIDRQHKLCEYYGVDYDALTSHELQALSIKYLYEDDVYKANISEHISINHSLGKYKNAYDALARCNEVSHQNKIERYYNSDRYKEILAINKFYGIDYETLPANEKISYIHRYHNMLNKNVVNHRVVSVKSLDYTEDVYDITVEDTHNFALSAGIFVHNSKDQADSICGAIWRASQDAEQFAFDYGEDIQTTTSVNLKTGAPDRHQINVDFEEELKNLLDPLARNNARLINEIQQRNQQKLAQQQLNTPNPLYINNGIMVW